MFEYMIWAATAATTAASFYVGRQQRRQQRRRRRQIMRYRHDGNGGAITAASAAEAARRLARRHFGSQGQVESLRMVARSWQPNGWGGGSICGKVWRAVVILAPTAEQRYTGVGYTRQQRVILMVEGHMRACDMPAP